MRAPDLQMIHQPDHVLRQLGDGVRTGRHLRLAVAARIVAQHAKMLQKARHLEIPHGEPGAERIRQHQHRRIGASFELIVEPGVIDVGYGHGAIS